MTNAISYYSKGTWMWFVPLPCDGSYVSHIRVVDKACRFKVWLKCCLIYVSDGYSWLSCISVPITVKLDSSLSVEHPNRFLQKKIGEYVFFFFAAVGPFPNNGFALFPDIFVVSMVYITWVVGHRWYCKRVEMLHCLPIPVWSCAFTEV